MSINDQLAKGIGRDELAGIIRLLPPDAVLYINRNMLIVRTTGIAKSLDQALTDQVGADVSTGEQERDWDIWIEGFRRAGNESLASRLGTGRGRTFREAVLNYFRWHPSPNFNPDTLSDWGCQLYQTEAEARATFG